MRLPSRAHVKHLLPELPLISDRLTRRRIKKQFELRKAKGFLPRQLAIETAAYCNAKCIMCPHPTMKRQKGIMSPDVHRMTVDKVAEWGAPISLITHAGLGEPLIDKALAEKIRYEKEVFKKARVTVFTNAALLDEDRGRELVSAGLDQLSISLNGLKKETYEAVMKLPYERTQQNIARFLEFNGEASSPVKVQVSLIPTELHSEDEIEEFRRYWIRRVDAVVIPLWISWGDFFKHTKKSTRWPCRYIWEVFMVDWDGMVKMCCEDYETRYPLGNLETRSPREVYHSPRMQKQRMDQVNGNFQWPEVCQNCIETHDSAREFWKSTNL